MPKALRAGLEEGQKCYGSKVDCGNVGIVCVRPKNVHSGLVCMTGNIRLYHVLSHRGCDLSRTLDIPFRKRLAIEESIFQFRRFFGFGFSFGSGYTSTGD